MLHMPMIFGDHMVLQRQKPIELWGEANPSETVAVSLCREKRTLAEETSQAGADGQWRIFLPAQEAMRGLTLTVTAGMDTIAYHDVLIGEVWIAGGQSNMEFFLQFDADREIAFAREENPDIRFFDYPEVSYEGELDAFDFSEFGLWRRCRREDLPWYSAVAYWFACLVREDMDVPVGIVGCNWGGTRACCWIDRQRLEGTPGAVWLQEYDAGIRDVDPELYRKVFLATPGNVNNQPLAGDTSILWPGFTRERQLEMLVEIANIQKPPYFDIIGPDHPWRPCGLYETMLTKVAPYTCRGVLWYQGESDEPHAEIYDQVLAVLTRNWRDLWHEEALPFLMVQLAPFGAWLDNDGARFPILRDRQERAARDIPGVWLASSSDAGMEWDIHPKHKRPIGERLALLALGHIYGQDILCEAPVFESAAWADGKLIITLKNSQGLYLKGDSVQALLVDGVPAQGCIKDEKLVINCPAKPSRVEYAQTGYYEVNLYNGADIPAMPFAAEVL